MPVVTSSVELTAELVDTAVRKFIEPLCIGHVTKPSAIHYTIIEAIDDEFLAGNFHVVDRVLQLADIDRLEENGIVALLSITLCARDKLPARAEFIERCDRRLRALLNDDERVDRLLKGLR